MSDNIDITWKVGVLECYPTFSGHQDYVFTVHWDCLSYYSGTSGGPYNGRTYSCTSVPLNTGEFIPYDQLTQAQVLDWVWDVIGTGQKESYEESVRQQIYNQINPPVVTPPLPWLTGSGII